MIPRSKYTTDRPVYEIDDSVYRRFPVYRQGFVTLGQKDSGQTGIICWVDKMLANMAAHIMHNTAGKTRADYALEFGGNAMNMILGMYGMPNFQFLKWNPLFVPEQLYGKPAPLEPEKLTELVKYAAGVYGSDLVGVARLDRRWVYSEDLFKPFVFADTGQPAETDDGFIIPDSVDRAVVMAVAMNIEFTRTSPAVAASTAAEMGYSRMGILAIALAEFIRSLGYIAIPCMNDTALSIPLAIDAGLGQIGRNGLLITPEYGPCVRLCKVLTNMPLLVDRPVDFGITDFCRQCLLCARECPPRSISFGRQSFATVCENNNPGVKTWYVEAESCLRFWQENGAACANCIAVCPFTAGFESVQCVECERCDNPGGCSLQTVTVERQKHGYVQVKSWGARPESILSARAGL
ncbi:MAG: reductive dehalogenase [Bacillota bacterium]